MRKKFIGREEELKFLKEKFENGSYENIVVYGRRRIGKTTLLLESVKNKKYFYFIFSQKSYELELKKFVEEFSLKFDTYLGSNINSFYDLFLILSQKAKDVIFLLDEFTYMIEKDTSFVAEFQKISDMILKPNNMKIVLSGSSISVMETEVLSYKSPLYGRRTGQIKLKPFSFFDIKIFFPKKSLEERFKIYSVLGGVPFYLEEFDENLSFEENLKNKVLSKNSLLFGEGEFLLREELREPEVYFRILQNLSYGVSKLNELAEKSYVTSNNINKYLRRLELLEIVKPITPISDRKSKFVRYKIIDNYFRFYFQFCYPNLIDIEQQIFDKILNNLNIGNSLYSIVFEEISQNFATKKRIFNAGISYSNWWYKEEEIDIVGFSDEIVVFGECKFEKTKMKYEVFENLLIKKDLVKLPQNKIRDKKYVLFAKNGFNDKLLNEANIRDDLLLFNFEDLDSLK